MDLQTIYDKKNSKNPIVREVAVNFEGSLLDMKSVTDAVREKRLNDADLYYMMLMQSAVSEHNNHFLKQMHDEIIKRESRLKGKIGDVVMVEGEKHIIMTTENGYVTETMDLFKYAAMNLYDGRYGSSYLEVIQRHMDELERD